MNAIEFLTEYWWALLIGIGIMFIIFSTINFDGITGYTYWDWPEWLNWRFAQLFLFPILYGFTVGQFLSTAVEDDISKIAGFIMFITVYAVLFALLARADIHDGEMKHMKKMRDRDRERIKKLERKMEILENRGLTR